MEVVGRLSVEWAERESEMDGRERSLGVVLDELGQPVAATLVVTAPPNARLSPCAPSGTAPGGVSVSTTPDGHFCFVSTARDGELSLRVEAPHHEATSITPPRPSALGPRILRAPDSIDLDSDTSATFEILPATTQRPGRVELWVECGGERVRLHDAPSDRGLIRAEVEPSRVPGPGACTVVAEQTPGESAEVGAGEPAALRSRSHPLLGVAKATLTLEGTSVADSATTVRLRVTAGPARKNLDAGVIEVWHDDAFVASAPIDRGEASVVIPHGRRAMTARISLADGGPGVIGGASIELPIASVGAGTSRSALVGWMVFGTLGVWLVWLWLGRERRTPPPPGELAPGPGVDFQAPERGHRDQRITGRVTDAYTKEPLAGVVVLLQVPDATSVRLIAETRTSVEGSFRFEERHDVAALRRLRFESDGYVSQEARVSGPRVVVRLVSLRHALLDALRTRGQAVTKRAARVTPSELSRLAAQKGNARLSSWALAVERAVYGPGAISQENAHVLLDGGEPSAGEPAAGQ